MGIMSFRVAEEDRVNKVPRIENPDPNAHPEAHVLAQAQAKDEKKNSQPKKRITKSTST
jgi:hypothetical protein